ncbi:Ig-like domain-containing protein [Phenylobacterium sp.]|uniref:Ig-like domain-containing protein n=1 Tax=Phenylobacterium sp. TaxID=1871053 RepID=UPI002EDAF8EA
MATIEKVETDSGVFNNDYITNDTSLTVTVELQKGNTYRLLVDGSSVVTFTVPGGPGPNNVEFTHNITLTEGGHTLTLVRVTGPTTTVTEDTQAVTIDLTAPNAPSILEVSDNLAPVTGVVASGGVTNDATPTVKIGLAGTNAVAGDQVQLFNGVSPLGGTVTLTATHITLGFVEITTSALTNGQSYAFNAKVIDIAGNASNASGSWSVTIDNAAPPAPAISLVNDDVSPLLGAVTNNGSTNDTTPTVRISLAGTGATAGFTVQLHNGAATLGPAVTVTAADVANGYVDITTPTLSNGVEYRLNGRVSDLAGNLSGASGDFVVTIDTTPPAAPVISTVADETSPLTGAIANGATTNDTQLKLSGSAEANAVIKIFDGATLVGQGVANNGGNWNNVVLSSPLGEGAHTLTVVAVDAAGNESAAAAFNVVIDTIAPGAPSAALAADTGASNSDGVTQNGLVNVTLSGDGVTWSYSLDGGANWIDGEGASFTVPGGTHAAGLVQVRQADAAGNTSPAFSFGGLTIDATPPAAPAITAFSEDTGVAGDGVTADTTLTLSGTAEANAKVAIYDGASLGG